MSISRDDQGLRRTAGLGMVGAGSHETTHLLLHRPAGRRGSRAGARPRQEQDEDHLRAAGEHAPEAAGARLQAGAGIVDHADVEVANPMSIYPEYKATRSLFLPDPGKVPGFTVEIATDKGVKGYGSGGAAGGVVVEGHLTKLLMGEDPFNVERCGTFMWRSTMYYGRMGVTMNAISGVDLALWDLIGNALGMPVYKLLGGQTKDRIPAYCTGNDIEQHVEFGYKRLKLAMPHGPADGREGMRKNEEVVKRARAALGPDGDIMLDCWMAWTERYTIEMAEMLAPYRVYWMEEVLQPHDYAGFGRLRKAIKSTRIVTGRARVRPLRLPATAGARRRPRSGSPTFTGAAA